MAQVVGPRLLAARRPRADRPGPRSAGRSCATVAPVTWLPVAETKNVPRDGPNRARVTRSQRARTSVTSPVSGSRRDRLPLEFTTSMVRSRRCTCSVRSRRVSPVRSPQQCISVKNAAACHRHGEAAFSVAAAAKNASISSRAQQVGVGGHERGLPPVGQDVGVTLPMGLQPPADVADVGHPGPVTPRAGQPLADPSLDGVAVEDAAVVRGAVGVELLQVPDPGGAVEAHLLLEREVGLQLRRERTGEAVTFSDGVHGRAHGRAPQGRRGRSRAGERHRRSDTGRSIPGSHGRAQPRWSAAGPTRAAAVSRRCAATDGCCPSRR